jgi:hypothetical protein
MLLLTTMLMLMSVLMGAATHNLTELLAVDALTVDLDPIVEIQADMIRFADAAKILFAEHFPEDYVNTANHQQQPFMAMAQALHNNLVKLLSTFDPEMSPCRFAPLVIEPCEQLASLESFATILETEVLRTRECASEIFLVVTNVESLRSIPYEKALSSYASDVASRPPTTLAVSSNMIC